MCISYDAVLHVAFDGSSCAWISLVQVGNLISNERVLLEEESWPRKPPCEEGFTFRCVIRQSIIVYTTLRVPSGGNNSH